MLGGHQRADKMQRALLHQIEVYFRVVSLVEDQCDLVYLFRQSTATGKQLIDDTVKHHRIVLIAGIGVMQQGYVAIGGG